ALGGTTLLHIDNARTTLNGVISGQGAALQKFGQGNLVLGGTDGNTFNGGTILFAGSLEIGKNNALGGGPNSSLIIAGGLIRSNGFSQTVTVPVIAIAGSVPIGIAGSGDLRFSKIAMNTTTTFEVTNSGVTTFDRLEDQSSQAHAALVKSGPGRLVLAGQNGF